MTINDYEQRIAELEAENAALKEELFDKDTVGLMNKCKEYAEEIFKLRSDAKIVAEFEAENSKLRTALSGRTCFHNNEAVERDLAELKEAFDKLYADYQAVEEELAEAEAELTKYREWADVIESIPEQIQDAINHGVCQTCAVESKLASVMEYTRRVIVNVRKA